jgi:hypothetical protein
MSIALAGIGWILLATGRPAFALYVFVLASCALAYELSPRR